MPLFVTNRQYIAIWLSAILLVLSVAASAHSVEHLDEGAKKHCTLCFHQHQFNQALPQQDANLEFIRQEVEPSYSAQLTLVFSQHITYQSRAPPSFL
jgi:hypothetical protein